MARTHLTELEVKRALKEAFAETLHEQRELIYEIVVEALEGIALSEAIHEGLKTERLDAEQLQLGASDKFWELIRARRGEETISRAALDEELKRRTSRRKQTARRVPSKGTKPRSRRGV